MTVRSTMCALAGASAIASAIVSVPAVTAGAHATADSWRFVRQTRTLAACNSAGRGLVMRRMAREFKCENDYDRAETPVLDLYVH